MSSAVVSASVLFRGPETSCLKQTLTATHLTAFSGITRSVPLEYDPEHSIQFSKFSSVYVSFCK